ncbi:tandem-95 repeat protein, partial [Tenacibaculum finnmarkense]|uniref:tandem-95 repeat protein n=1 Tax=Tenacibaculum finnmarkense TaxID=2781243 RepID=UPI001EFAAF78
DIVDNNDATDTNSSTLDITVKPIKDAIDDKNENLETNEETKLIGNLFDNLTDADSPNHTITGAKVDVNGDGTPTALVLGTSTEIKNNSGIVIGDIKVNSNGTFEFTPATNYNGAVPTIGYDIVDNNDTTDTDSSTLDITVKPVKDAITDLDENLDTNENTPLTGNLFGNLTDADSSSHSITVAKVDTNGDGTPTALVLGTSTEIKNNSGIVIGDIKVNSDGTFEFTPATNYNGAVPTIGYDIVDNNDATDTNSSKLDITVKPVKDAITDLDENLNTNENTPLTGNLFGNLTDADSSSHSITGAKVDTNGDGTPTALVLGTSTEIKNNSGIVIGDIKVNSDGTFEFTPVTNYNGAVPTIGYDIVDNNDATDTDSSKLDITVNPVKDAITDLDENLNTNENTPLTGNLFGNLTDADSSNHTITGAKVDVNGDGTPTALVLGTSTEIKNNSGIVIGNITVNSDGTFEFTPATNYNGDVPTIGYDIVDNNDTTDTDSSTLDITVKPVKDAIDDKNENLETNEETKLTGDLFDNLTDADSSNHTITGATV